MKRIVNALFAVVCLLSLNACRQVLYFPDRANTPALSKALEAKATISIKPQSNDRDTSLGKKGGVGTSIDLAFSPLKHIGIIGSYRWINNRIIHDQTDVLLTGSQIVGGLFNGKRWELGGGYYNVIKNKGIIELYGGYGNGSLNCRNAVYSDYNYDTRYYRFFIQPAMGMKVGDIFSFTGGFKLAFLRFYDFNSTNPDLRYDIGNSQQDITKPTFTFLEPFLNFECGYKYFKGNVQVGASKQLSQSNIVGDFPVYISFGMTFMFSPGFLKKDKQP